MKPITRDEIFMAAAAGEYDGELPAPITRQEQYLKKIKEAVENGSSVAPEDIDAAIEAYLNSHDADIVTEQELSDELSEYYNKTDIDNALDSKADITDIPDVSGFVTADNLNILLADKQDLLTAGRNLSFSDNTINHSVSGVSAGTYGSATQVPQISIDAQGHVTDISEKNITAVPDLSSFSRNCFCRTDVNLGAVSINNIDDFISSYGITSGNYGDICVGAYFTAPYDGIDTVFRVAGFDLFLWTGDPELTNHHIVVVPDYQLTTGAMNSTNTTANGYNGSNMFTNIIGGSAVTSGVNKKLYDIFGTHLLKYQDLLSTGISANASSKANSTASGAAASWGACDVYANLMSGSQIFGEAVAASSLYDYGFSTGRFPLFMFEPKYAINRSTSGTRDWYWLKEIYDSTMFAGCNSDGCLSAAVAGNAGGVRPFFLLG